MTKSRHSKRNHKTKKNQKYNKTKKHRYNKINKICKYGCRTKNCGHTPFLYGGKLDDLGQNLAYTGEKVPAITPNPHFAYVGKGGFANQGNDNLEKAYPIVNNQYIPGNTTVNWLNSNSMSGGRKYKKRGGYPTIRPPPPPVPSTSTDTSAPPIARGGGCGCLNNPNLNPYGILGQKGGCGQCQITQKGGNQFYKNPLPYPNGLVGTAWTPKISSWPGLDGVNGNSNHYPLNTYSPVDISREMINVGASKPFISGGGRKTRKYKGGSWSNSFGQDLINLGRSSFYNMNTTFNALKGVPAPTNPLPWKEQL